MGMTEPGPAHPPGGALRHPSASARFVLAAGLLALGIGALAVMNLVLLPRYLAARQGPREQLLARARRVAALVSASTPAPSPAVTPPAAPEPSSPPSPAAAPPPAAPVLATAEPLAAEPEANQPEAAAAPPSSGNEPFPDLLFAINASWLSQASRQTLDQVAEALGQDPDRRVVLKGHTDTSGAADVNRALSRARARRAARYLRAHGVAADRIEIHSYGAARPVEGEMTRARNRRVEIAVQ
jgi:outer membrane protein OmpA-like peptidoglycan-associated protein